MKKFDKEKIMPFIQLHILLFLFSLGSVCSKVAGQAEFLSMKFIIFYGIVLVILFGYALVWQQLLKKLPLVTAYANKAVTVIWGLLWGTIIFKEKITLFNILGAALIILGIYVVVKADES
ncbi:MAG: EamA family transporter [Agathobacter sp.]|nr:EamA family transporter [Agathobacter sp.]